MRDFETHRCEGSLRRRCSIRKWLRKDWPTRRAGVWTLSVLELDVEWDYWHMHGVADIRFCPWCGKELE